MIRTERLLLRPFCGSDYEGFAELIRDKMAGEYAVYDGQWPVDDAGLRRKLDEVCKSEGWYAVVDAGSGRLAGFVTAYMVLGGTGCEIGYTVHSQFQRRGIAYEACSAVLRQFADTEGLRIFLAGTAINNVPSVKLLEKLGFRAFSEHELSFAEDDEGQPIVFKGMYYGCLSDKWR